MNWKTILITLLSLGLLAFAIFMVKNQKSSTELNEFVVADTSIVEQIYIANKNNDNVKLTKKEGIWYVNEKEAAIGESVRVILKTMLLIEIKRPVAKSAYENSIKNLATSGIKVEIYQRLPLISLGSLKLFYRLTKSKVFYVGNPTQDLMGTLLKSEKSDEVYVTYLPGFNGYLTERFSPYAADWISHNIFNYSIKNIQTVTVEFGQDSSQAYKLLNDGSQNFKLYSLSNDLEIKDYDTIRVLESMASFRNVNYELLLDNVPQERQDSILSLIPYRKVTVTTKDLQTKTLRMYLRPNYGQVPDLNGKLFPYDVDRMYAYVDGIAMPLLVQYFVVDNITRPLAFFSKDYKTTSNYVGGFIGTNSEKPNP
jgi:hypothetical protein